MRLMNGILWFTLSLGFLSFGIATIRVLKTNFPEFHAKNGCKLILTTVGLSVPLMTSVAMEILLYWMANDAPDNIIQIYADHFA
jgi:hypothetical protein